MLETIQNWQPDYNKVVGGKKRFIKVLTTKISQPIFEAALLYFLKGCLKV
jgi:hypothetical protein